jgi:hypothetical protein
VSATSILAHCDADLEWGGDHPISEGHGKKKNDLPRNPRKNTKEHERKGQRLYVLLISNLCSCYLVGFVAKTFFKSFLSVSFRGFRGKEFLQRNDRLTPALLR